MSVRTAYTTDALSRIRSGATANDLGWDEPFYRSICRRHGIHPVPSPGAAVVVGPSPESPAVPAPVMPAAPSDAVCFDEETRTVSRADKSVRLQPYLAHLFVILWRSRHDTRGIDFAVLVRRSGVKAKRATTYLNYIRRRIAPLGITITKPGQGGACRLIDSATQSTREEKQ